MPARINYTNKTFNRLTVVRDCGLKSKIHFVECLCVCGNKIKLRSNHLKDGHTKSCGCLSSEVASRIGKSCATHAMSKSRFYGVYTDLITRCENPNREGYEYYGGRGIKNEFKSFEHFKETMYESYLEHKKMYPTDTSIDRIDVNGHYSPENCRWTTAKTQRSNQRKL